MPDVKGSNRRSAPTRRRVIAAAHGLFVEHGYAATTFQQVADAAGVSVQTVYFHFGNKSGLLKHVMDVASAGDDAPVPLLERDWFTALRESSDPREVVAGWVTASGVILDRVAPILAVVRDAAPGDADMAAQWEVNGGQRRSAHGAFVAILTGLGALRPRLGVERATDVTVGLLSPDLFLVLTRECGWKTGEWAAWTTGQLAYALLADPPPAG
ncbi:TetR/AcrR family transcriptional regulator [Spongiactinospora sp. TRM90649]|uniref:TetR/AcrR family transcriptional regulator n=1 Tax=Spongiactinospora sp. TRM90649 TaxID=3031114 RepID=UPI0023F9A044|nr:TetR/AcrR family transcriptional regulator [Spongiactinospora sp. TRM90649]MDF5758254.1 TetR/AcrR family transcriptional regulator [Spongiactinospora sp. TRM90649]